jgi:DNA processing protein
MERLIARLAVHRISFLRPAEKRRVERAMAGGLRLGRIGFSELERLVGRLLRTREWKPESYLEAARRDVELLARLDIRYISEEDAEYPPLLREIHDPPFGLFARGALLDNRRPSLAIVGTRRATGLGTATATDFGRELALAGIPVVSGLARGIDAAAHRGALAAKAAADRARDPEGCASTMAVLPVGIDSIYPPSHRGLASAILEKGGSLLSEYSPGEGPCAWRFPERNRIIAGMTRGTLVVEAPESSGALITSSHALDMGRDVFVAAAVLEGPMNAGADRLAAEGAGTLASHRDLLAEWGFEAEARGTDPDEEARVGRVEESSLAEALRAELGLYGRGEP